MSTKQKHTDAQTEAQQKSFIDQITEAVKPIIEKMDAENDAIIISVLHKENEKYANKLVIISGDINNLCNAIHALNEDENFKKLNSVYNNHRMNNNLRSIIGFLGDSDCKS